MTGFSGTFIKGKKTNKSKFQARVNRVGFSASMLPWEALGHSQTNLPVHVLRFVVCWT